MILAFAFALLSSLYSCLFGENEATLVFAGDAMMHKGQLEAARRANGEYDFSSYFGEIAPYVSAADYAVVNLEVPLGGKPYSGYPCFCAPDNYADALTDAGFDLLLTANNHTLDRQDRGLKRTIDILNHKGIPHVGTYRDVAQRDSLLPLIQDIKGFKIAFLNYTYGTNGIVAKGNVVVDYIDRDKIKKDITKAREKGAELVCVAMHWGDEYHLLPNASQKQMADFLVSEGVELVIGGHPHVIQPMEMRERVDGSKALVVYSLGNFISDMKKRDTRGGVMAKVKLKRDENGKAVVDAAQYRLVFTILGRAGGKNFSLVWANDCQDDQWGTLCSEFVTTATAIFDKHNLAVGAED